MKALKSINNLFNTLSDNEKRILFQYLTSFTTGAIPVPKSVLLLNLMEEGVLNEDRLCEELLIKQDALRKLAERLLNKMLETLTLELNVNRPGEYTQQGKANILVRKYILRARLLPKKGLYEIAQDVLKKAIKTAKKFELFAPLIEALYLYYQIQVMLNGDKQSYKIKLEIEKYEHLRLLEVECEMLLYGLHVDNGFSSYRKFNENSFVLETTQRIQPYIKHSARLNHYFYSFQRYLLENEGKFEKAINLIILFIDFIKNNRIVYKKRDHGILLLNLANYFISFGSFKQAKLRIDEACNFFEYGSYDYCNSKELEFYIQIFSNNSEESEEILGKLLLVENLTFHLKNEYLFLLSNVFFIKKDFKQSRRILSKTMEIEYDKNGWNFAIKLLLIMSHMELEDFQDQAMLDFENLKRYRNRALGDSSVKDRCKLIVYLINSIQREGYNYTLVGKKEKQYIDTLSKMELELPCVYKSANIILFSQWIKSKINEIDFVPDYSLRFNK